MRIVLRRLLLPVVVFLAWAPAAQAWSWPVQGAVLRPFAYDEGHPYDAGQHRGIDIASDAAGESVIAPAAGTVSFAGTVPTSGMCVTIQTPDGYSVTLTHLGSILVAKGLPVAEGDAVGTIGPSGTAEFDQPYLHLGIRATSDPNGYLDPLGFLPAAPSGEPQTDTTAQPSASGGSATASPSASATSRPSTAHRTGARHSRPRTRTHRDRGSASRPGSPRSTASEPSGAASYGSRAASAERSSERPAAELSAPHLGAGRPVRMPHSGAGAPGGFGRPPTTALVARGHIGLGTGREPSMLVTPALRPRSRPFGSVLSLVLNGAAALVALTAALAARRRSRARSFPLVGAQISNLPRALEYERLRQAA